MAKSYRGRRRTFRKKRTFRKRIMKRTRYNKPDMGYSEKVVARSTLFVNDASAGAAIFCNFHWLGNNSVASDGQNLFLHD